jgi:hypothetical protein
LVVPWRLSGGERMRRPEKAGNVGQELEASGVSMLGQERDGRALAAEAKAGGPIWWRAGGRPSHRIPPRDRSARPQSKPLCVTRLGDVPLGSTVVGTQAPYSSLESTTQPDERAPLGRADCPKLWTRPPSRPSSSNGKHSFALPTAVQTRPNKILELIRTLVSPATALVGAGARAKLQAALARAQAGSWGTSS